MKILCLHTNCGPSYVRNGWRRVFEACGHTFRFWHHEQQSAFDAFNEFEPDLCILTTYDLDRAQAKCIASRPHMKVIMFASAWGPFIEDVDLKKYPIVVTSEAEKRTIEKLKKETGKPDFVFIHAHSRWLDGTMSGWSEIGVPYHGILNAADTFAYLNGNLRQELTCDVGFVGGYWGYKAQNLNKYILPLCHRNAGLRVKVFGNSVWPVSQYLGSISDQDSRDLFASATVCPNVSEPHSTDLGWDVIERVFKVPIAGGVVVSDYVEEARDLFTLDELPMAKNPSEMEAFVRYMIEDGHYRDGVKSKMKAAVLDRHTYWERTADFFAHLGMVGEAKTVLNQKQVFIKG